jgi:hypothetical protein
VRQSLHFAPATGYDQTTQVSIGVKEFLVNLFAPPSLVFFTTEQDVGCRQKAIILLLSKMGYDLIAIAGYNPINADQIPGDRLINNSTQESDLVA